MTNSRRSYEPLQHSAAVLLCTLAAIVLSPRANAAPFVWNPDLLTAGAQDGGGDWDTGTTNWFDQANNVIWANANEAIFGAGTDGTYAVAVALNPSATALTFNNSGYTLSALNPQTIVVTSLTASVTGPYEDGYDWEQRDGLFAFFSHELDGDGWRLVDHRKRRCPSEQRDAEFERHEDRRFRGRWHRHHPANQPGWFLHE